MSLITINIQDTFFMTHNLIYMKKHHFNGKTFYNRLPEEITEMGNIYVLRKLNKTNMLFTVSVLFEG